ncbi:MFS transporter [Advenella kashmirensis W13003]|uniref:MFS transporter n=1 Tax=Advenella kashmirensis W13003 TaxID=1424334 RepID=V8QVH7_9BURK|nr:tripartite tricarboxylate transporter substrate binding protein [Advenella kashmirensis]ETF02999.1 MFS transporter [Advenella kashmirensis W13003]
MKIFNQLLVGLLMGVCAQSAWSSEFKPSKPVTLIVPYGPGGGTDTVGRLFAQKLSAIWGQPVVVDNRSGGDGSIGAAHVARSKPDGTTLLLSVASIVINPYIMTQKLPYNTKTAFTPITTLARPVVVMIASSGMQAKNVPEFISEARKKPGKFTFGSAETSTRMYGERLKESEKFDMQHIGYRGSSQWTIDLLNGLIDTGFMSITSAMPFLKDGKVKVLGVLSSRRSELLPNAPTLLEQGISGLESHSWYGLFGPGKMPKETVDAIYEDVKTVLTDPEVLNKLKFLGAEIGGDPPEEFNKRFQGDLVEYEAMIRRLHLNETSQ